MESKIKELRGYCFVRDVRGGLVNLTEVSRITIRKQASTEPAAPPQYGIAVKPRGESAWVIMETGTYESCRTILDKFSDAIAAYDSLSAVSGHEPEPEPAEEHVEEYVEEHEHHHDEDEHAPEPEFHEEHEPEHVEEHVEEAEHMEHEHEEEPAEEPEEEHVESDEESAVQELLLDE